MTKKQRVHGPIPPLALFELFAEKRDIRTIVEGKNDVTSLARLGFVQVEELGGAALFEVVERFEKGETVQLLVDLDAEGKKLYRALKADLTQRGVRIDNELREALFRCPVRQIEDLATWIERQQENDRVL
jgi:5S rRNA maturation endonuclease (ribonuclease M5)